MRVIMINTRPDDQKNPGGDSVQLSKTRSALEMLGVDVEVRLPGELDRIVNADLIHLFNIQTAKPAWQAMQAARHFGLPIVLSPIYWDVFGLWYEDAIQKPGVWQLLAKLTGKPASRFFYIHWQTNKAKRSTVWKYQREMLSQSDAVLPNSKSEATMMQDYFSLGEGFCQRIAVIPNGIDTKLYNDIPTPSEAFYQKHGIRNFVLEVGRITPVKNQLGLIDAMMENQIPLVFIGQVPDEYREYAARCRQKASVRGNVIFIDHLPYEQLPSIYALASVHALPSWRETPGLVSLEAAAAGCKIVTTTIGSTRDYFGNDAWYCDPHRSKSIRSAVESAYAAPTTPKLRERVLNEYTWQRAGEATLAAYENVLINHH